MRTHDIANQVHFITAIYKQLRNIEFLLNISVKIYVYAPFFEKINFDAL
jgi:hypothetical protein